MTVVSISQAPVRQRNYEELLAMVDSEETPRPSADVLMRNASIMVTSTGPIDYWDGMIPLREFDPQRFTSFWSKEGDGEDVGTTSPTFRTQVYELLETARWLASHQYFQGDTSVGPYLSAIPSVDANGIKEVLIVAWKQSNNGASYVATSRPVDALWSEEGGIHGYVTQVWMKNGRPWNENGPC